LADTCYVNAQLAIVSQQLKSHEAEGRFGGLAVASF